MLKHRALVVIACVACGSSGSGSDASTDVAAGDDGGNACNVVTTDASFTCDVSVVPPADRGCAHWAGPGNACTSTVGWSIGAGNGQCMYDWIKSGPPDLCKLPAAENGTAPFGWLRPTCDTGCDASFDVAPPSPCATSSDCPSDQYCETQGSCAGGTCFLIDNGGVGTGGQVCGCDGKTYVDADAAHQSRVSIAYAGACE